MYISLEYIIRSDKKPDDPIPKGWDAELFEYPLEDEDYDADNAKVAQLLHKDLYRTEACSSAKNSLDAENGRQGMFDVIEFYEKPRRAYGAFLKASNLINQLVYAGHEDVFPFRDYSYNLMHLFGIVDNHPEYAMRDSHKRDILFRQIDVSDAPHAVKTAIEVFQCQRTEDGDTKPFFGCVRDLQRYIESAHC